MEYKNKIQIWQAAELDHRANVKLEMSETFEGPVISRKCTDLPCLLIYLFSTMAILIVTLYCYYEGDPERTVNPYDFRAEICGTGALSGFNYGFFADPLSNTNLVLCLSGCPAVTTQDTLCLYQRNYTEIEYCYDSYAGKPYHNRYCLPANETLRGKVVEFLDDKYLELNAGDIYRTWDVLCVCAVLPIFLGTLYMVLLRFSLCVKIMSVGNILLFTSFMILLSYFCFEEGIRQEERRCDDFGIVTMSDCSYDTVRDLWSALSYTIGSFCLIALMLMLCLIPRMQTGALTAASLPLMSNPSAMSLPFLGLLGGCLLIYVIWVLLTWGIGVADTEIESVSNIKGEELQTFDFDLPIKWGVLICVMICLWILSSVASIIEMVSNTHAAYWFFALDKEDTPGIGKSLSLSVSYHIGSIAYGAFILPIVKIPRSIIYGFKSRLGGVDKSCANCCVTACYPFCVCHDDLLKYPTEKAYAYSAIWGTSFGESCLKSYFLLRRAGQRVESLLAGGNIVIWIYQGVIALSMPVAVAGWILYQDQTVTGEYTRYVSSIGWPCAFSLIISSYVSHCFGGAFRGLMHGVTLSYLCDQEMFSEKDTYAPQSLIQLYGNTSFSFDIRKVNPDNSMTFNDLNVSVDEMLPVEPAKAKKKVKKNKKKKTEKQLFSLGNIGEMQGQKEIEGDIVIEDLELPPEQILRKNTSKEGSPGKRSKEDMFSKRMREEILNQRIKDEELSQRIKEENSSQKTKEEIQSKKTKEENSSEKSKERISTQKTKEKISTQKTKEEISSQKTKQENSSHKEKASSEDSLEERKEDFRSRFEREEDEEKPKEEKKESVTTDLEKFRKRFGFGSKK